jgi:hypothetical protein
MQNWQQYKQFMPVGMIDLFEGKYYWKMPSDIGPTAAGSLRGAGGNPYHALLGRLFPHVADAQTVNARYAAITAAASQAPWVSRTRAELLVPHQTCVSVCEWNVLKPSRNGKRSTNVAVAWRESEVRAFLARS